MKVWILMPFVLVLGFMLGSWGPTSEMSDMRKENKSLRLAIKNRKTSRTPRISSVTQLLGIDERNSQAGPVTTPSEAETPRTNVHSQEALAAPTAEVETENSEELAHLGEGHSETNTPTQQDNFEERMEKAAELWAVRVDISRSVFISNVGLGDEEVERFDMLVDNMNVLIGQTIADFSEAAKDAEMIQSEAGIRLANDIMTSVVATYDAVDATMPEDWRRSAGKEFTLTDFIDPRVAMPLSKVENKLPDGQWE